MDCAPDIATTLAAWLRQFGSPALVPSAPTFHIAAEPVDISVTIGALAALAAEALAWERTLVIVTADDSLLPDISNALDLQLRPLCLVLPGADYAGHIALRATLSLLKSRLTRAAADSDGPAWAAMRTRLQQDDDLWRACLAWSARGLDRELPPPGIHTLFPVRICPWPLARKNVSRTDWVMMIQSGQLPTELRTAWPGALRTLLLPEALGSETAGLAPLDESIRLRAELEVLGQELAEMELEFATAQGELAAFTVRYHALIAGRMAELDRIQADLARVRMHRNPHDPALGTSAAQAEARAAQSSRERDAFQSDESQQVPREGPFAPDKDLKKRFRQLAQKIHPDRASDEDDRAWRTQLMSEANRAYRAGDIATLDEILAVWLEGRPGTPANAVAPTPSFAATEKLTAQIAAIKRRIATIATELDRLYGSKLYELFAAARMAGRQGRDLLQEMAARIDTQIALALDELNTLG